LPYGAVTDALHVRGPLVTPPQAVEPGAIFVALCPSRFAWEVSLCAYTLTSNPLVDAETNNRRRVLDALDAPPTTTVA
jgi:hypothetical protein